MDGRAPSRGGREASGSLGAGESSATPTASWGLLDEI